MWRGTLANYPDRPPFGEALQAERTEEATLHHRRFEVFREVHKVRDFQLALCACVWDPAVEYSARILEEAVGEEKAQKGFDNFLSGPLVDYFHGGAVFDVIPCAAILEKRLLRYRGDLQNSFTIA